MLPDAFKLGKAGISKTFEAKVIILTMAINKFQTSWLTFDLSAKVAHIGDPLNSNSIRKLLAIS